MSKSDPPGKRKSSRVELEAAMNLVVFNAGLSSMVLPGNELIKLRKARIVDLSASGLKIRTNDFSDFWAFYLVSGGINLAIKFALPDGFQISATAKVAWLKDDYQDQRYKYTGGLEFLEISSDTRDKITEFIVRQKLNPKE
jgi:c-di-GMP-binding flagellar brake protein YcgR